MKLSILLPRPLSRSAFLNLLRVANLFVAGFLSLGSSARGGGLDEWTWRNPLPQGNSLRAIASNDRETVVVGSFGTIVSSPDWVTWSRRTSGTIQDLNSVAWGAGKFIAVGGGSMYSRRDNVILSSSDGVTWTPSESGVQEELHGVTWSGTQFIAVGEGGTILSSENGLKWTTRASGIADNLRWITWTGERFAACGENGAMVMSQDGVNWTTQRIGDSSLSAVVWAGTEYFAVADGFGLANGFSLFTSPDGVEWRSRASGNSWVYHGLVWNGTQLLSVGSGVQYGGILSVASLPFIGLAGTLFDRPMRAVTWKNGHLLVVGSGGVIRTGPDGGPWTSRLADSGSHLRSVTWGEGRFVAVGDAGTIVTSSEGDTWTPQVSGLVASLRGVAWSGRLFVAAGEDNSIVASPDGIIWSKGVMAGTAGSFRAVTWGAGRFVAVGSTSNSSEAATAISEDGLTWMGRAVAMSSSLSDVVWSNGQFIAVGEGGKVLTSLDGVTWTVRSSLLQNLHGIAAGEGRLIVVGETGIATSMDGLVWTDRLAASGLKAVVWNGIQFVATMAAGTIYTSSDGIDWLMRPVADAESLNAIAWNDGRFVTVGNGGAILTADVETVAPVITAQPVARTATAGETISLSVQAQSAEPLFFEWEKDGLALTDFNEPTLLLTNVVAADAGVYRVRVSNSAGHVASLPVAVTVNLGTGATQAPTDWKIASGGRHLASVADNGNRLVAVGDSGAVLISQGAQHWSHLNLGVENYHKFSDIASGGGRFVAVGAAGVILASADGLAWTSCASGVSRALRSVAWTGTEFVACGEKVFLRSPDGIVWTARETSFPPNCSIVSAGNLLVVVGDSSTTQTSSDGMNWTTWPAAVPSLRDVTWGGGQFVAVGPAGMISTSSDGMGWVNRRLAEANDLEGVTWNGRQFVAVGSGGTIWISNNAAEWSKSVSGSSSNLTDVVWAGNEFIVVGARETILTSPDGTTWLGSARGSERLRSVARGDRRFVAVGESGTILSSWDGLIWTAAAAPHQSGVPIAWRDVIWDGTRFLAVGRGTIAASSDGRSWSSGPALDWGLFSGIAIAGNIRVMVGWETKTAVGAIWRSTDGEYWTNVESGVAGALRSVAWSGHRFVAVGDRGVLLASDDGNTWASYNAKHDEDFSHVTWANNLFVAVGAAAVPGVAGLEGPLIYTSPDGVNWTRRAAAGTKPLWSVGWSGREFMAVGGDGSVFTSDDGTIWSASPAITSSALWGLAFSDKRIVAVGDEGTVFYSNRTDTATVIVEGPKSQTAALGGAANFSVTLSEPEAASYQWRHNGRLVPGQKGASLALWNLNLMHVGLYDAVVDDSQVRTITSAAVLGILSTRKVVGSGLEVGADLRHPTGNVFDQVLVTGRAEAITADWTANKTTRTSFIDLDGDIVQVEFSGPGTLTLLLDEYSDPAPPVNYNQAVNYAKGHAAIVISGADERTNLSVFTVGRATAVDPTGGFNILLPVGSANLPANNGSPLFAGHPSTVYDGVADIAFIAITSTNGKFGGVRTANADYFANKGITGIYAPGVAFHGPLRIGNISAFDDAEPVIVVGSASDVEIAGGDLWQEDGRSINVRGIARIEFVDGSTSHGVLLPTQRNKARMEEDGVDVTEQIVVNPAP